MRYYVDTCIWLNLIKKEGDASKGKPYWKIAEEFFEKINKSLVDEITYSGIILRELELNLDKKHYKKIKKTLKRERYFRRVEILQEDKRKARKLESEYDFEISYYDLTHMMLVKRLNMVLITRDRLLIDVAKENGIEVSRPEDFL